jgi:hypothetical protein
MGAFPEPPVLKTRPVNLCGRESRTLGTENAPGQFTLS